MLLGLLPEDRLVKDTTLDELADFMAWVGEALLEGVVPSRGYYKEPWSGHRASRADKNIAAPFVFAFAGLQSDNKQNKLLATNFGGGSGPAIFCARAASLQKVGGSEPR